MDVSPRTTALAAAGLSLLGLGLGAVGRWPAAASSLACAPVQVRFVGEGSARLARCTGTGELPRAHEAQALGLRFDLNVATAAELARIPGVGPQLAQRLTEARHQTGGFATWAQVDAVAGVGPAKLARLQEAAELR